VKIIGELVKGAASCFIIVAFVLKCDGVEKLINRSVKDNDFLDFRYELSYNVINLCRTR
jgi:hypothetical protein